MALGVDTWCARIVLALRESSHPHIKLISAIPFKNQWEVWMNQKNIDEWFFIYNQADVVHYVSEESYTPRCLQKRNEWMVDNSDMIIAVWDGSKGGTDNCIKYAKKYNINILNIDPNTLEKSYIY